MHLPLLPVLWPQIRIIRCIRTSGTLTCTAALSRFMFPSLSCLYRSQLALLVSSAALSSAKLGGRKKTPSTLINQTWAFRGPQLPIPSSTLSSFRFPSNPISNSPFWQLKMGWWKLCKWALFVMLFFCIHPSISCLFNTPKQGRCAGLGSERRQLQGVSARCTYRRMFSMV